MEKQKIFENVWIRALAIFCALVLFFTLCYFLKGILISFFLAFTVAYIFDPAVDFIARRKLVFSQKCVPRGLAVAVLLTLVFLVMGGLLTYTVPKTVTGIQSVGTALKEQYPRYQEKVEKIIEEYGDTEIGIFLKTKLHIETIKEEEIKDGKSQEQEVKEVTTKESDDAKYRIPEPVLKMKKYVPQALNFVLGIVKNIFYSTFGFFGIVMNVVVFGVVMVYLLKDFDVAISKGKELLPVSKKDKISGIISKIDENLKAFFRGQMAVCAILSIIYGIGLTVIGIPMSFLLALVGGFGNMIPYVGIGFGLIPAIILAFIQFQDITHILLVGLVFGIGQFLEGTVMTPKIVGDKLGLHPVAIILAILICGQMLGFLGLLLAVPIASIVKVLIDEGIAKYKDSKLFKGS
ncbi:MAG: AI-2E family transporter [Candidatus Brocadiaceae bacterium]|nr:AI-2E family transporter [Candidatus Brocadiaceae bacterium]